MRLPPVCPLVLDRGIAPLLEDGRAAGDAPAVGGPVDAAGDLGRGDRQRVRVEPLPDDFLGNLVDRPVLLGQDSAWAPFRLSGREAGSWAACPAARN